MPLAIFAEAAMAFDKDPHKFHCRATAIVVLSAYDAYIPPERELRVVFPGKLLSHTVQSARP